MIGAAISVTVVSFALLIAAYTGNPWATVAPGVLFVFVAFPRWRSKMYRLVDKAVSKVFRHDRCNHE